MNKIFYVIIGILFASTQYSQAQCKVDNKYFQAGEELTYDLYFKWGLVNAKAGSSTLKTTNETYAGTSAYKMSLTAKSSGMVNKMFSIDDVLTSYAKKDLTPLAFHKDAKEGDDHTIEDLKYTYGSSGVTIQAKRVKNGSQRFDETIKAGSCVYDMVSVVFYARTLDYSSMKKGDEKRVDFISGKKKAYMLIEYQGVEKMKANDGKSYSCIKLVLSILNTNKNAFEDKEEAMKVYITNDNNRMPVRLDSKLKVGSTRAILRGYKGLRHPVSAQ